MESPRIPLLSAVAKLDEIDKLLVSYQERFNLIPKSVWVSRKDIEERSEIEYNDGVSIHVLPILPKRGVPKGWVWILGVGGINDNGA